ncbi:putative MFS sugar transporter [Aspergillus clavatus NRRL 1]|uniref:MFS sugar transporter, putative n=1 Tax=Aspergillus clavatus (strain ATCC 1007 / CBS 513.65 / DSM 816 / NCTC 3887 / NRRL 1 / QM 1276 / 107) TaxID=344612 RepID=A1CME0_ASPCL|nr:MFS sugar transporter, putative [Aspergillus clavatus NRRL 1]EAW08727.1 MFS sugar transporter, putative [Aspergillus clavatus NRRL 1]
MTAKDAEVPHEDHKEVAVEMDDIRNDPKAEALNEAAMDAELEQLEQELQGVKKSRFELGFSNPALFTYVLVAFASLGGLLSGLDQSLISGANLTMPEALHLSASQASLVNAGMSLGAVGGALILGPSNEYLGRRMAIIVSCVLYTIGAGLMAGAISFGMMFAGRFVLGMGVGLEGGTVPVYVAESVPSRIRGNLVSLYQLNIALGEVLGYAVGAMFFGVHGDWRFILGSSLVFSTLLFVGMIFMPESPRYLMHKSRPVEAYGVWKRIRGFGTYESKAEFLGMRHAVAAENEEQHNTKKWAWLDFFTDSRARRAMIYANVMVFLGQFTGVNAVMTYMGVLMTKIGFDSRTAVYMSLVGGGSLLLGTIPAVLYMEKFGRRYWANVMLPGFFLGLVLVGAGYTVDYTAHPATAEGLYLTGIILYMGFFGSYACLTWVIPAEVFPTYLRSYGMTTADANLFLCSFIVTYNFTRMMNSMTRIGLTLGFYGGIAVLGWFYQVLFMPETKNKSLEEIDELFSKPTSVIVRQNVKSTVEIMRDLGHFRFRKVFTPSA